MAKKLVAYFSASGVTKQKAEEVAKAADADIFEIAPPTRYTDADLDWKDKQSRSTVESNDPKSRPEIEGEVSGMEEYDTVFIGFPVWWYTAPHIIFTFLESYDFTGKKIYTFATSGGGNADKAVEDMKKVVRGKADFAPAKMLNGVSNADIDKWVQSL